jgi:hypothetical protein
MPTYLEIFEALLRDNKMTGNHIVMMQDDGVTATLTETQAKIIEFYDGMIAFLFEKNKRYGDTALHPMNDLSNAEPVMKLLVRAEDKLSRIRTAAKDGIMRKNDYVDLMGYLTFIMISKGWTNMDDQID